MHHVLVIIQEGGDVYLSELIDEPRNMRNVLVFVAEVDVLVVYAAIAGVTSGHSTGCSVFILGPPESVEAAFGIDVIVE